MNLEDLSIPKIRKLVEMELSLRVDEVVQRILEKHQTGTMPSLLEITETISHHMNADAWRHFPGPWIPLVQVESDRSRPELGIVVIDVRFIAKLGAGPN